jgi:hypothetical protein
VTEVSLPLARVAGELDARVPRRVADDRGRSIGVAGHVNATVDRGPFTLAVAQGSLLVRTELRGHVEACASGRCYATCDPIAIATAEVPLRLTPSFQFSPSRVSVAFTRGCKVRALGGILRIDITPTIEALMGPALRRVEREIDGRLPQPRAQAERLWDELGAVRTLPLGGCVVVQPRRIVQGPTTGVGTLLNARFALVADPEIRARCGEPSPKTPLPPLVYDARLPPEDDLVVAGVAPLASAVRSLAAAEPFDLGFARARITGASAAPGGPALDLDLSLSGEACGDVALRGPLAWAEDGETIRLASVELAPGEAARLEAAAIEPAAAARSIAMAARIAPALTPAALGAMIPELAGSLTDPSVDVKATVREAKPLAAFVRGEDLVATVRVRGSVAIAQK